MTLKHHPMRVMIEKTASAKYLVEYIHVIAKSKGIVIPIDFITVDSAKGAKYTRIAALEGHIRNKRLFFFAGLPQWEKMLEQFTQFPKGKYAHDDYPDTVALMAKHFGAAYVPLATLPQTRSPLIAMMERDIVSERDATVSLGESAELPPRFDNDLGDFFAC